MVKGLILSAGIVLAAIAPATAAAPHRMLRPIDVVAMPSPAPVAGTAYIAFFAPDSASLTPLARRIVGVLLVHIDHRLGVAGPLRLDQRGTHDVPHAFPRLGWWMNVELPKGNLWVPPQVGNRSRSSLQPGGLPRTLSPLAHTVLQRTLISRSLTVAIGYLPSR